MDLLGIHHLTAISAKIRENHRFCTQTLGMRLVKRSVNQDDVRAYHLFYADAKGSPGTDLTFFDWPAPREPNGVLFEIATDGPGFAVDQDPATLGEKIVLPPFLEGRREEIVGNLLPID